MIPVLLGPGRARGNRHNQRRGTKCRRDHAAEAIGTVAGIGTAIARLAAIVLCRLLRRIVDPVVIHALAHLMIHARTFVQARLGVCIRPCLAVHGARECRHGLCQEQRQHDGQKSSHGVKDSPDRLKYQ